MAAQFKNGFAESAAIKHLQMFAGHISGYVVESEHASFRFKFWEDRRPLLAVFAFGTIGLISFRLCSGLQSRWPPLANMSQPRGVYAYGQRFEQSDPPPSSADYEHTGNKFKLSQ